MIIPPGGWARHDEQGREAIDPLKPIASCHRWPVRQWVTPFEKRLRGVLAIPLAAVAALTKIVSSRTERAGNYPLQHEHTFPNGDSSQDGGAAGCDLVGGLIVCSRSRRARVRGFYERDRAGLSAPIKSALQASAADNADALRKPRGGPTRRTFTARRKHATPGGKARATKPAFWVLRNGGTRLTNRSIGSEMVAELPVTGLSSAHQYGR